MKTRNAINFPSTLEDLIQHEDFTPFGSSSDDWLCDPERMARCYEAAGDGGDGSTHYEHITAWREFLSRLRSEASSAAMWHDRVSAEIERRCAAIDTEIDACEKWHEKNGSLHDEIG